MRMIKCLRTREREKVDQLLVREDNLYIDTAMQPGGLMVRYELKSNRGSLAHPSFSQPSIRLNNSNSTTTLVARMGIKNKNNTTSYSHITGKNIVDVIFEALASE